MRSRQPPVIPSQLLLLARDLGAPIRAGARKARFQFSRISNCTTTPLRQAFLPPPSVTISFRSPPLVPGLLGALAGHDSRVRYLPHRLSRPTIGRLQSRTASLDHSRSAVGAFARHRIFCPAAAYV